MLYLIGTGLYYLNDIPLRAVEILKKTDEVFLEQYTNINDISFLTKLEGLINKKIIIIGRDTVESDELIERAVQRKIALLVPGDPLFATTHVSLIIEAKKRGVEYKIIHASSILSSIGETGLSPYKFGAVSSIPIEYENFRPESFFDVIEKNQRNGLHSLVLLEYKSKNEFVNLEGAMDRIKRINEKRERKIKTEETIAISKLGSDEQRIQKIKSLKGELPPPLAIIIPGELSSIEKENLNQLIE